MTFGFRVVGDSGYYQIDEQSPNLFLVGRYSLNSGTSRIVSLTVYGDSPLPVLYSPNDWVGLYRTVHSGNSFTYYFLSRGPNAAFDVYIFDRLPANATWENWSINVFDASGRPIYIGNGRLMQVATVVPQVLGSTSNSSQGANITNGFWGATPNSAWYSGLPSPGGSGARVYNSAVKTLPSTISAFPATFPTGTNVPVSQSQDAGLGPRSFLIVDLNPLQ